MKCPVRGHDHDLQVVKNHVQDGTGAKATTYGCPSGNHRWFVLEGRTIDQAVKLAKPRWGWRNS